MTEQSGDYLAQSSLVVDADVHAVAYHSVTLRGPAVMTET